MQTRYYDPDICRFISADDPEILGDLASVVGQLNLYAYCLNNPVMYTDPSGYSVTVGLIIAGLILGAVAGGVIFYNIGRNAGLSSSELAEFTLGGVLLGVAMGASLAYLVGPALMAFAAKTFTFTIGGMAFSGGGVAVATASVTVTITGAQVIAGVATVGTLVLMAEIGKSGGYIIKKYPNDHDPSHVHIYGDDIPDKTHGIRIGSDGKPLPGEGKLPPGAKKAIKKLLEQILKALSR